MKLLIKNSLFKYDFLILLFTIFIIPLSISAQWDSLSIGVDYDFKAVHFITDDIGFLGGNTSDGNGYGKILKTIDGGENWTEVLAETTPSTWITDINFVNASVGYASNLLSRVYKTVDQGETWTYIEYDGISFISPEIEMPSEDIGYVIGWGGEVFRTENAGVSWEEVLFLGTIPYQPLDAIECIDTDTCYVGGQSSRLFKTIDRGDNWTELPNPNLTFINTIDCLAPNDCMLSDRRSLFTSDDYGMTWDSMAIPVLYPLEEDQTVIISNFIRWDNTIYTVGRYPTIASSFDGGETWQSELDSASVPTAFSFTSRIYRAPNDNLYAVGEKGQVYVKVANPTSNENYLSALQIKAYPNPTFDIIHIEWLRSIRNGKIIIYHSDGRKLEELNINGETKQSIDISNLATGFYYFSIVNDEGVFMDNISVIKLE